MALESVLLVLVAGLLGIAASLLGNHYLYVQEVRGSHHEDFRQKILSPWRVVLRTILESDARLAYSVSADPKNDYTFKLTATMQVYNAEPKIQIPEDVYTLEPGISAPSFTSNPLWNQSKEHWPNLHKNWDDLNEKLDLFSKDVKGTLKEIDKKLSGGPTVTWGYRGQTPECGIRDASIIIWRSLVDFFSSDFPKMPEFEVSRNTTGTYELSLGTWGRIAIIEDESDLEGVKETIKAMFSDDQLRKRFEKLFHEVDELKKLAEDLIKEIERVTYDQNLAGRCEFCPQPVWERLFE